MHTKFLVNKTNRRTEFQFYRYYDSTCYGQPFCPSSGVLSRTSALVHFTQIWWPFGNRSRMELCSILLLMMGRNTAETCRVVIPIKLEFSASVGFIHKERTYAYLCFSLWVYNCVWLLVLHIAFEWQFRLLPLISMCQNYDLSQLVCYWNFVCNTEC